MNILAGLFAGWVGFQNALEEPGVHVHLLVSLKATHCLADVMRELKKASSVWVHDTLGERQFAWQEGYAAFTVSASALNAVKNYIDNQEEHHRVKSFHEELIEMLNKAGVDYNPAYL
jgi:putative transposase